MMTSTFYFLKALWAWLPWHGRGYEIVGNAEKNNYYPEWVHQLNKNSGTFMTSRLSPSAHDFANASVPAFA